MEKQFPRTEVGGVSLPRMIIGTNWIAGYSHRTPSADRMIKARYDCADAIAPMLDTFLASGVDAVMAPFGMNPHICDAIKAAEDRNGRGMIMIDTPVINVDNTAEARREAEKTIRQSAALGAKFCLIHHYSAEQLVNKNKRIIDRLDDYTKMIRDAGMIPGLSAHMPELILYSDDNGYDVETYIQIYNCMGFLMQVEIEAVNSIIRSAKHPVITIKSMAAGRTTPFVGLNFSWATLRDCDMVTVGCFSAEEAAEDIEISMAALERRAPDIAGRASPAKNQSVLSGSRKCCEK